ncbi:MAG: site-specific integrase [Bryobacteraceae bacterium]
MINKDRRRDRRQATFEEFVNKVFIPNREDPELKPVRGGTLRNQVQRLKAYVLPCIGPVIFENLEQEHLRGVLKEARKRELGAEMLRKIRTDLIHVCRSAAGEGYLDRQIWEKLPVAESTKAPAEKRTVNLEQYADAWVALAERDRIAFHLVMLFGLRESEVFALRCGDILGNGLRIDESVYGGQWDDPKGKRSWRKVYLTPDFLERLTAYKDGLPANDSDAWLFPSTAVSTPEWPGNAMKNRIRPALAPLGLGWLNFAILRRSYSTLNRKFGTDDVVAAHQQGHDKALHLREYVQVDDLDAIAAEAGKLSVQFNGVLRERARKG